MSFLQHGKYYEYSLQKDVRMEGAYQFKPGDFVRLKSGGPVMSVELVEEATIPNEGTVRCMWSEDEGNKEVLQRQTFPFVSLEKVEQPATEVLAALYLLGL